MRKLDDATLRGFHEELEKFASLADFVAKNHAALGSAGALLGHGAAIGAGIKGLHDAYKGYEDAKAQGAGTGHALVAGLGGGVQGAMSGATAGALIGGGLGYGLGTLRPQGADTVRKALSSTDKWYGALGRFGQRQMHGLTGWKPPEGYTSDAIRGGSWATERAAQAAAGTPKFDKLQRVNELQKQVESKNMTNLPGIANALRGPDKLKTLGMLGRHAWHNADPLTKFTLATAPLSVAATLAAGGEHKGENVGESIGMTAGSIAGSALPFFGGQAAMKAGRTVGKYTGKAVDFLRGGSPSHTDQSELATANGNHIPSERYISPNVGEGIR